MLLSIDRLILVQSARIVQELNRAAHVSDVGKNDLDTKRSQERVLLDNPSYFPQTDSLGNISGLAIFRLSDIRSKTFCVNDEVLASPPLPDSRHGSRISNMECLK
jgi:hypothetical protein